MKTYQIALFIAISFTIGQTFAQTIPTAPNQRNTEGKRIGEWVITYTKDWKETSIADSIAFYRKIAFDKTGKPYGKTRDYYRSGSLQFEGMMLQIEPEEITDGICFFYHENGLKSKETTFVNGKEEGLVKTWYDNGRPQFRYENRSGVIDGIVTGWNEKGDSTKQYFENGKCIDWQILNQDVKRLYQQGKYNEAIELVLKSLNIIRLIVGEDHPDYVTNLYYLANLYESIGQFNKAEHYYLQIINIFNSVHYHNYPNYAVIFNNLAELYRKEGLFSKAEPYYKQAINIINKQLPEKDSSYAICLNNMALLYRGMGEYQKAEPYYMQALDIFKRIFGDEHQYYATSLNNFAGFFHGKGQYPKAEFYYLRALSIRENKLGEKHPLCAESLNNLARLYQDLGQFRKSESFYMRALSILEIIPGKIHPFYTTILTNLSEMYFYEGKYSKTEAYLIQVRDITKKIYGGEHHLYANCLNNLAVLYHYLGQFNKGEYYYNQALMIVEKRLGEGHPSYANYLNNLASLYTIKGQHEKAEHLYLKVLDLKNKMNSVEDHNYSKSLFNIALLYLNRGKYIEAESYLLNGVKINKDRLLSILEISDQEQQEAYINFKGYYFEMVYSFYLQTKTSATPAYESALLSKGIQLQNTSHLLNYIRQSNDSLLLLQYDQWVLLKKSIITQNNKSSSNRINVDFMQHQADSIYKAMARKSADFRNFKAAFEITPQAIQQELKSQEAAIEFVHFQYYNGKRWTDSIYYAALILRKGWVAPRMVYLCEQRQLDSLISPKVKKISTANEANKEVIVQKPNRGVEVEEEDVSKYYYELLWKPFDSLLLGVRTIYFSPSGTLHRINLAAIKTPIQKQRLIDKYDALVQLSSTRVLALPENNVSYHQNALLLGGIQYDADTVAYQKANATFRSSTGKGFGYLPFTEVEITKVTPILQGAAYQADTLKGIRASEEGFNFYAKLPSPRIIHLATHGFFLEDTLTRKKWQKDLRFEKESVFVISSNPMLRSGLVLAGGNQAWRGKEVPQNQADGILTAEEISQMNLRNTELVVLSACETGLGDIKGAEGVFGLQRAFKMAGVKYLMMSLWQVSDEITSQFMTEFYTQYLKNKKQVRVAFQEATNSIRKNNRDHPYLWAPFILVE